MANDKETNKDCAAWRLAAKGGTEKQPQPALTL